MKQTKLFLLVIALCSAVPLAHADYQFTWEGNSNLFQGTFDVTDAEMAQTNMFFYSLSLTNSISITSPDGYHFQWGPGDTYGADGFGVGGSALTNSFLVQIYSPTPIAGGGYLEINANKNSMQEILITPGPSTPTVLNSETGSWNITYVPEPSALGLLAGGAAACWIGRRRLLRGT
jgi:PEP-CTERM motif